MGTDYLAYALIDIIVDNYFLILEKIGEDIDATEEILFDNPTTETLEKIHKLKKEIMFLRKSIWPLREVIGILERGDSSLIHESTCIYLSSISNKMNEVMKVLTIIATIFIPLTFIAGIYGMNFRFMPELEWRWGYFAALSIMMIVAIGIVIFCKKKKWL